MIWGLPVSRTCLKSGVAALAVSMLAFGATAQPARTAHARANATADASTTPDLDDIPAHLSKDTAGYDYEKRVAMIPMRDGVKLYTVIMIPKGAHDAPIALTRTPYNAAKRVERNISPSLLASTSQSDEMFVKD